MSQFHIARLEDLVSYTIESSSSEDGNFPWSQLLDYQWQFDGGKAIDANAGEVLLDFGEPRALNMLCLYNMNIASFGLRAGSTTGVSDWAALGLTATENKFTNRYNYLADPGDLGAGAFNYRYLKIEWGTQTPVDGSSQVSIGSAMFSESSELLLDNTNWGLSMVTRQRADQVEKVSGAVQSIVRGRKLGELAFTMQKKRQANYFDQVTKYFLAIHRGSFLIIGFNGLLIEGGDNETYCLAGNLLSEPSYALRNIAYSDVGSVNIREIG